ncbi:MAG: lamin tail domain-containing protein, partial [Planctomycetes bacterium]|nr:lamin tail domain-containing protein [Planctomycetota bacterium]
MADFGVLSANWLGSVNLKINELMASNTSTRPDDHGEYDDWIEIYNPEDVPVDIGGMYLTDDLSEPTKWRIPDDSPGETTISPQGYLLIWADGEPEQGPLHVDFKLENTGEEIGLFTGGGSILIDSVTYGWQITDISFGRYPDAADNTHFFDQPTPETENVSGYLGRVAQPEFSVRRGFYEAAFGVVLTCPTEGATMYYTLDSTDPTEASTPYTGPVAISGTACLRAAAFKTDYLPSVAVTHTYIFVDEVIDHPDMWTTITNDPVWGPQMKDALLEIPTISLVTPHTIPDEPIQSPPEVPTSIEMIFPDGAKGFQANAGVERFGGQYTVWPKQALRISFKSIYGPSRLEFDLFGDTPYGGDDATDSFNQIILRNGSHDSLFSNHYTSKGVYTRNRYCFDRQIEMGHLSLRGRFVHMYLNGVYWGLYHLMERPTADFMAAYLGGDEEDYDIMKGRSGILNMEGDRVAWDYLVANTNNYEIVQEYMDIDNYIDYMLLNFYGGNDHDWYPSHNWVAGRRREAGGKFMFFMWDNDFLVRRGVNSNTTNNGGPGNMQDSLVQHKEFKIRLADRAQKHFFNGGMLTPARVQADFTELTNRIERISIPEYARWSQEGKLEHGATFTPDTLQQSVDWIKFDWGNVRTDIVVQQMRDAGLFPSIDAPSFNQHGGSVSLPFNLEITAPAGTIYYTLDGSDPRQIGGITVGTPYSGPIPLTKSVIAKARARFGKSTWSALNEATFGIGPIVDDLRITEIMYHPTDPTQAEKDAAGDQTLIDEDFEFIELKNIGTSAINLNLVHFTDGIDFTFGDYSLGAGDFAVV